MNKLDIIIKQNEEILDLLVKKRTKRAANMANVNKKLPKDHYKKAALARWREYDK